MGSVDSPLLPRNTRRLIRTEELKNLPTAVVAVSVVFFTAYNRVKKTPKGQI